MGDGRASVPKRVTVWRNQLVPLSETFIPAQVAALTEWEGELAGVLRAGNAIGPEPGFLVQPTNRLADRIRARAFLRTGRSPAFERYLDETGTRILHAHFLPDGALASRTASRMGLPWLVTAHGYDTTQAVCPAARELNSAAAVVAVSSFIAERLVHRGVHPDRIRILPIGIVLPTVRREGPRSGLLFVGRLVEKKGCGDLLAALHALPPARRPHVTVVGAGPLRGLLEARARELGVEASFLGAQPPERVRELMGEALAFCVPSRIAANGDAEGFGMVFLEAAAVGTPTVSYASGGVPEAVLDGQTGLLAAEGDTAGLAERIEAVTQDMCLRDRLGAAAQTRVRNDFDITRRTIALERLYDELT